MVNAVVIATRQVATSLGRLMELKRLHATSWIRLRYASVPTAIATAFVVLSGGVATATGVAPATCAPKSPAYSFSSVTATVSAEAGVVFAKASTAIGVGVTASRSWTSGFKYTLTVPKGLKRRMRLMQESRTFLVTKKAFDEGACRYVSLYSNSKVNAPRRVRNDSWVLEP